MKRIDPAIVFIVIVVGAMFVPGILEGVNRAIDAPLVQVDRALGLPTATPRAKVSSRPVALGAVVEAISVEIAPGCWREVDAKTDRRLWGWGWGPDGGQIFNTTYQESGSVVEETLTLEEILAISSDWRSWEQECP